MSESMQRRLRELFAESLYVNLGRMLAKLSRRAAMNHDEFLQLVAQLRAEYRETGDPQRLLRAYQVASTVGHEDERSLLEECATLFESIDTRIARDLLIILAASATDRDALEIINRRMNAIEKAPVVPPSPSYDGRTCFACGATDVAGHVHDVRVCANCLEIGVRLCRDFSHTEVWYGTGPSPTCRGCGATWEQRKGRVVAALGGYLCCDCIARLAASETGLERGPS